MESVDMRLFRKDRTLREKDVAPEVGETDGLGSETEDVVDMIESKKE
jgi:hypothetical protein